MRCIYIWALVALAACVHARTATKQQTISAQITSLTDKDARSKAMVHPAFANAGRQAGIEIWRIEDFNPVAVPQSDFGKFYKGDSYIVLKTTADKRNNLSWDIHYWLGSETSQDESGAAAILTVGLDDKFNGAAVQHRETQAHESSQFLGYFKPAIRYLDGGHASGFNHVTTNAGAEKRLFQIKGKRNVRVRQVEPSVSSMNKGDCFILDVNHDIYVYVGDKAKNVERLKAISVANQIRDQDHNGRGHVEIIDQYSSEVDVEKFFTALGSGSRNVVPDETTGGDDQAFEKNEEQTVTLSEISDSSGSIKVTPLTRPYKQEQLKPQECYILDTVSGSIYVWVGKQATDREKSEAMSKAQQYLSSKNYPSWVHVSKIPQGTEPAAFKQYFTTWKDVGMSHSRLVRSLSDEELFSNNDAVVQRRARSIAKTGAMRGYMPDDGTGTYVVYRIENTEPVLIYDSSNPGSEPGKRKGEMFQGDSYVIPYQYDGVYGRKYIIYFWLGKDSTQDEQAAAAIYSVVVDRKLNGEAELVRVPQGEEPKHFLKIFNGRLVTLTGGKASGFRNTNQKDTYDNDGVRLFKIYGTEAGVDLRADQVPEEVSSLQSDDVFLLETPEKVYLWYGQGSSEVERQEAIEFVHKILGANTEYEVVRQNEEPVDFWNNLNGDKTQVQSAEQWRERIGKRVGVEPRLFEVDLKSDNTYDFEEVYSFKQRDLDQHDSFVLDAGEELYVWIGKETSQQLRKSPIDIATAFTNKYKHDSVPVVVTKQGLESDAFIRLFEDWDPDMWQKNKIDNQSKEDAMELNEV